MLSRSELQNQRLKRNQIASQNRAKHKIYVDSINEINTIQLGDEEPPKLKLLEDDTKDNDKDAKTLLKLKSNVQSMSKDLNIIDTTYNALVNNLSMYQINQVVSMWSDIFKKATEFFPTGLKPAMFNDFIIQYLNKYNNVNTTNTKLLTAPPATTPKTNKKKPPLINTPIKTPVNVNRKLYDTTIPSKSPKVENISENNEYLDKRTKLIDKHNSEIRKFQTKLKDELKNVNKGSDKVQKNRLNRINILKNNIDDLKNEIKQMRETTNAEQFNSLTITGKGMKKKKQIIYGRGYDIPNNDIHIINNKYELNMKALNNGTLKLRYAKGGKNSVMPITYGLHKSVINTIVHLLEEKFDRNVFNSMSQKDKDLIIKFCDILHYNIGMTVNKKDALEEQINIYIGEYLAGNVSIKPHLIKKIKEAMDKNMITSKNANAILNQIN